MYTMRAAFLAMLLYDAGRDLKKDFSWAAIAAMKMKIFLILAYSLICLHDYINK